MTIKNSNEELSNLQRQLLITIEVKFFEIIFNKKFNLKS